MGGSLLRVRFDARPRGWFRLVFPAFVVMARRREKANMAHLREAVGRVHDRGLRGRSDKLDRAMARFARAYADQTEADHAELVRAVRQGAVPVAEGV